MPEPVPKAHWKLSAPAFRNLLRWLDEGLDSEGGKYLVMRTRLVAYFDRKGCRLADELADETLNRIARRLAEEGQIETETPAKYCYIVARFVFLESRRAQSREESLRTELRHGNTEEDRDERETRERMLECLDQCTAGLEANERELILCYYIGIKEVKIQSRRRLAKDLGITMNALSIRACRIRDKLEDCVTRCVGPK